MDTGDGCTRTDGENQAREGKSIVTDSVSVEVVFRGGTSLKGDEDLRPDAGWKIAAFERETGLPGAD